MLGRSLASFQALLWYGPFCLVRTCALRAGNPNLAELRNSAQYTILYGLMGNVTRSYPYSARVFLCALAGANCLALPHSRSIVIVTLLLRLRSIKVQFSLHFPIGLSMSKNVQVYKPWEGVQGRPYLTPRGLSRDKPRSLQASLANMSATSVQCQGSRRSEYGLDSRPR